VLKGQTQLIQRKHAFKLKKKDASPTKRRKLVSGSLIHAMASLPRKKVGVTECGKPQADGPSDSKEPDLERDTGDGIAKLVCEQSPYVDQSPSVNREGQDSELAELDDTAVNPESTEEDQWQVQARYHLTRPALPLGL
jgi:hypothetical protein